MLIQFMFIILGFVVLIKGADFLVEGASQIAKKFNIPELVIGLTIVAIGTSMPELMVSLTSALEGHSDLAIGNVVGSNIANLFLILGVCSTIKPLVFKKETKVFEMPFTIFVTALFFYICIEGNEKIVNRKEGIILLLFCIVFFIYNSIMAKKGNKFDEEDIMLEIKTINPNEISIFGSILKIIIGIIALKIGGDLVVDASVEVARQMGISEKLISLTIVAFSTSLPELITSITATRKGDADLAIGNVLGSQILNILLIIGISAVVSPIQYSCAYNGNIILLIIGSIMLFTFPYMHPRNKMTRGNGIGFLFLYASYMLSIILPEILEK